MTRLLLLALLSFGCEQALPCYGPQDCHGNACCFDFPSTNLGLGPRVYCTTSADACVPANNMDTQTTRLCGTPADCTAGGISTVETICCPSTVMNRYARTCTGFCQRSQ